MSEIAEQTILLVDTDLDYLDWATRHLEAPGIRILRTDHAEKAIKVVEKTEIDLVIADLVLQPIDGIKMMGRVRAINPDLLVILTGGFPSTGQIIEATQQGAHDILRKESLTFELRPVVEAALSTVDSRKTAGNTKAKDEAPATDHRVKMIGNSKALQDVFKVVGRVARTDVPVLVTGESGTGKELVSHAIHEYSPRCKNEMLVINCGAIPENLLESELFGHEKGSFTGASARRAGRFEQCDGGTLFLDEIGDMPASVQVKLLRVLQDGTFSRVGSNETQQSDVRIVAATNKDLAQEVADGNFREDLYYRLNVVEIHLPPLRDRREDVPLLADFFLRIITRRNGMARLRLTGEAKDMLQAHSWPGNVRELENTIARACALASSDVLLPEDIPLAKSALDVKRDLTKVIDQVIAASDDDENVLEWVTHQLANRALERCSSDPKAAAKMLGISKEELKPLLK
ncbi:sigma-54-dependent transcriptional regulator [Persicirhabdus sediminis]|uniref:Sigma-54-dependent Fis family transcriptional regulator n=1 Tax=Persicirhabdus sediminis TaxID=454144 RepID=A0A8J7SMM9_9BACT|nr:sigma-54 dependent transcriptional regulator [Persicirhabdus sediminis]MBK1792175.1 sigma-54-dependent Fis family transcriptional regulator [Persicirhabdus sediminis]